ncbi:hypothetical protein [Mycolicibacterium fortuitum]|uniref:hypothetical protein n=1 Tax=Mycolicibacterium fortuitum TaxID=1766 RepID=UPI002623B795|nr:hypothetical protein [Mycolicibacterium fortuitum]
MPIPVPQQSAWSHCSFGARTVIGTPPRSDHGEEAGRNHQLTQLESDASMGVVQF